MKNHHKGACPLCGGLEGVEDGAGGVGGAVA